MIRPIKDYEIPAEEKPLRSLMEPPRCTTCDGLLVGRFVEGRLVYECSMCPTTPSSPSGRRPR